MRSEVIVSCALTFLAITVTGLPAAAKQESEETLEELQEDFNDERTGLQTELKNARANAALNDDTHAQAILNAIEVVDKKIKELVDKYIEAKRPLSKGQLEQWFNDVKPVVEKSILSELKKLTPEHIQPIRRVLDALGEEMEAAMEIAEKIDPDFEQKMKGQSKKLAF